MKLHNRKNLDNSYCKLLHTLFQKEVALSFQNKNNALTATVGKSQKGFNPRLCGDKSVGYHITPHGFLLSQKTQKKALENTKRPYAQGGHKSLQIYLKRWRAWASAGFHSQVHSVEDIIRSLVDKGTSSRESAKFTEITKPAKTLCVLLAEQP